MAEAKTRKREEAKEFFAAFASSRLRVFAFLRTEDA